MTKPRNTMPRTASLFAISGLACAMLGACTTVGPDYTAPSPSMPAGWVSPAEAALAQQPVRWWSLFNDPVLDGLIDRAVENNRDLRVASARIREARALLTVAGAASEPTLDAGARASHDGRSRNTEQGQFGDRESTFFDAGFDASWELDVFGGTRRAVEAARADVGGAVESRGDLLVTLLAEVARAYTELRGGQRRLEIARKNIDTQRKTVELAQARFKAGLRSDLDVAQAETQLAFTQATVPALEQAIRASMFRLALLLGEHPSALVDELGPTKPIPTIGGETIAPGLPSDLLRRRADIRAAERALAASSARIGVATADLFPRFSLTGSLGLQAEHFNDLPSGRSGYWSIGPSVRWPILSGGRIRANIEASNARQEAAAAQYEAAVLAALEDTERSLTAFAKEQERRESLEVARQASQRSFDLSNELYTRGLEDFLPVLDAQRSLFLAEDQLTQSEQTIATNLIALYKALGGGWEAFEPQTPPAPGEPAAANAELLETEAVAAPAPPPPNDPSAGPVP